MRKLIVLTLVAPTLVGGVAVAMNATPAFACQGNGC